MWCSTVCTRKPAPFAAPGAQARKHRVKVGAAPVDPDGRRRGEGRRLGVTTTLSGEVDISCDM